MTRTNIAANAHPPAELTLLDKAGIKYERIDETSIRVGRFVYWTQTGYWRAEAGDHSGYGIWRLIGTFRLADALAAAPVATTEMMPENVL